ncbi:MAG: 6-pyruvoyl tetrahydropterin synthase [Gammaproteobacteria bacterium]|nr:MAG: 6-pyruvoyl tetrahydropterin synthase [Gammaproteobacteria bacterium]
MTSDSRAQSGARATTSTTAGTSELATIEIAKDYLNFSAGHFTLFSATERENLHGHNWRVACEVTTPVGPGGLCFDYARLKRLLEEICEELDEKVLLPGKSPWLQIEQREDLLLAHYADERIPFLHRDVLVLNIRNITVEELAGWILERVRTHPKLAGEDIRRLVIRVSSGTNQWAGREWQSA